MEPRLTDDGAPDAGGVHRREHAFGPAGSEGEGGGRLRHRAQLRARSGGAGTQARHRSPKRGIGAVTVEGVTDEVEQRVR